MDGLIRVRGRLRNSEIEPDAKHPVLLPKDHHVSHLIILHYHRVSGHSDIEHTLSLRRQKYWITQARAPVRRLLSSCFDYRRRRAPLGQQKMASLPPDRVNPSEPPFSYVGVDCFGPLEVHHGRSPRKAIQCALYMSVYPCYTYCAQVIYGSKRSTSTNEIRQWLKFC